MLLAHWNLYQRMRLSLLLLLPGFQEGEYLYVSSINIAYKIEETGYLLCLQDLGLPNPFQCNLSVWSPSQPPPPRVLLITGGTTITALSEKSHGRDRQEGARDKGHFEGRCLLCSGNTAGVMRTELSAVLKLCLFHILHYKEMALRCSDLISKQESSTRFKNPAAA